MLATQTIHRILFQLQEIVEKNRTTNRPNFIGL